jgi:hypothetical protein
MSYRPYIWRKTNPEKRLEQKKRERARRTLRERGILPPHGEDMTEEQQMIYDAIGQNDFTSVYNKNPPNSGGKEKQVHIPIKDPQHIILYRAKQNALDKKLDFNLTIEDILIPEKCPYLDLPISTNLSDRCDDNYYSIDRIDSSKGYVKGNVQVISLLANTIKNKATNEQLITFAKNILKNITPIS